MHDHRSAEEPNPTLWAQDDLPDFEEVKRRLPVDEQTLVPVSAGDHLSSVEIASTDAVSLIRSRIRGGSVGVNVLKPEYFSLMIPSPRIRGVHINGQAAHEGLIYPTGTDGEFYLRGGKRLLIAAAVPRPTFIHTLAALRGIDPEDVVLDAEPLVIPPPVHARLFQVLSCALETSADIGEHAFSDEVFSILMDAYLYAQLRRSPTGHGKSSSDSHIVRRAEEYFASAEGRPVSLADLCKAAGVGKSTLYRAFNSLCGQAPVAYFQKRRLAQARSLLVRSTVERGAVKRAALTVGLTELGRFAAEYRRVFNESPSATLNRNAA